MILSMFRLVFVLLGFSIGHAFAEKSPNLILLTVDDMSCDSVGVYGSKLEGTSPRMDRLASQSLRFEYAHVTVGNCMPCRNVMFSGLYSHNNKIEGFYQVKDPGWPHMADLIKEAGYYVAIRGKVSHSAPYQPYAWDEDLTNLPDGGKTHLKDIASYGESTVRGIANAKKAGKPFFLSVNVSDPHKPFWSQVRGGKEDPHVPSRIFKPNEVPVPGFLFDDPQVRQELALYYSSVRRADDCVGAVLDALEKSGQAKNTIVVFLSDHGMPLPFAKTQLYHQSTRTPLMIRHPQLVRPGIVDKRHMVSVVDLLPTILEALGIASPKRLDGRSFFPILKGEKQAGRTYVIKEYNENAGRSRDPMRAVQTKKYLYLFNPWSNGERVFATATNGTMTCKRMVELAKTDEKLAARLDLYRHRVPEELYQVDEDPDCLVNLIAHPEHQDELKKLRSTLARWMVKSEDPLIEPFRKREDAAFVEAYVQGLEKESAARRAKKPKGEKGNKKPKKNEKKGAGKSKKN